MKYLKTTAISIALASTLMVSNTFASGLPNLNAEMKRQAIIVQKHQNDRIKAYNEAHLNKMRLENEAKMAWVKTMIADTMNAAPEIDPAERAAALARPVIRMTTPFIANSAPKLAIASSTPTGERTNGNIDMRRVEQAWLEWNNGLRADLGLSPYTTNDLLNSTAQDWSEFSRNRGFITHGRPGDGCVGEKNYSCYNFWAIDQWFKDRWVDPKVISRSKHTENIGLWRFSCNSDDCTDAAIAAIKKTFDFFHSEKSYNGVHYRSMINPNFTKIGVGFAYQNGTYYATIHYATDL